MPGRSTPGSSTFYEDFPYAWWNDFTGSRTCRRPASRDPARRRLRPDYADVGDQLERKITGITIYESQIDGSSPRRRRWPGRSGPTPARLPCSGGWGARLERYWSTKPA
jgi:hypothetical protein